MPDPVAVNSMFSRIAKRYDFANRLLSGGMDVWWRRRLVREVRRAEPGTVLDLATGSGDVAFALSRGLPATTEIIGMDFCEAMLVEAEAKKARASRQRAEGGGQREGDTSECGLGSEKSQIPNPKSQKNPKSQIPNSKGGAGTEALYGNVVFRQGDGMALPLPDACVDAVTISFGLRNMGDRHRSLCEMRRVLREGGRVFVLEFSQPWRWVRPFYYFYLRRVLPAIAGIVTGDRGAYEYLNESIGKFPARAALEEELRAAGFSGVESRGMTCGVVALHEGRKLESRRGVCGAPSGRVIQTTDTQGLADSTLG